MTIETEVRENMYKRAHLVAIGACPCPSDSVMKRWAMSRCSASCMRAPVGSTPGDRTNIRGVRSVESSSTALTSRTGGSTNAWPRLWTMKPRRQLVMRSARQLRTISIFCSSLQRSSQSPGRVSFSGSFDTYLYKRAKRIIALITL